MDNKLQKTLTSLMLVCSVLEDNVDKSKLSDEMLDLIKKTKKEALELCLGFEKEKPNCCRDEKASSDFIWYIRSGGCFYNNAGAWTESIELASKFHSEEFAVERCLSSSCIKGKNVHLVKVNKKENNLWFIAETHGKKTLGWCTLRNDDKASVNAAVRLEHATPFYSLEEAQSMLAQLPKHEAGEYHLLKIPKGIHEGLKKINWKEFENG